MRSCGAEAQHEPASRATCRATAPYFSLTTSLRVAVRTSTELGSGRRSVVTITGVGAQQELPEGVFSDSSQQAPSAWAVDVTVQHAVSVAGVAEHTPVAGRVSSTRLAPSRSPVSAATTERTCS